ncbi:MAG: glycosyltransferase, partial [Dehalococcoidia bacterium]
VVAFAHGPHAEVVIEGTTGYLVKTGDTSAMAQAIIQLLKNYHTSGREMGKKAAAFIAEKFS